MGQDTSLLEMLVNRTLSDKKNWIFDMDGTLTVPMHDFVAMRKVLGCPLDQDILSFIDSQEKDKREEILRRLEEIEYDIALKGEALPGCVEFLELLLKNGCKLGVVTRNTILNTKATLKSAGLLKYFEKEAIKTRECAVPKPEPDALHQLLDLWRGSADKSVMVGDYKHDINAGVAAGMTTVFFDSHGLNEWNGLADITVSSWKELQVLYLQ